VFAPCAIIVALAVWESVSRSGLISPRLSPPPTAVALALREWAASGELIRDMAGSLWRIVLGLAIGGFLGIGIGLLTTSAGGLLRSSRFCDRFRLSRLSPL
jgi:sulfonate transport system permease protein